jgi:hypothetical protein
MLLKACGRAVVDPFFIAELSDISSNANGLFQSRWQTCVMNVAPTHS